MEVDLCRRGLQSFNPAEFACSPEHLELLLQVRQLDLSHNALYSIYGLEGLTQLTRLNLSHNGLRSLGGGLPLTLRELDVSHNSLTSLQNAALLPLQSLATLDLSFNALGDLRGVPNVTAQLTCLDVRSNRLTSLSGIEHCAQLEVLHAEANLLREVADVASLKCLPRLTAVYLAGNPLLLRKRLLHSVRLLLPPSVEENDVPATAPPSSTRSSTAAPPSVLDTSSACSANRSVSITSLNGEECGSDAVPRVGNFLNRSHTENSRMNGSAAAAQSAGTDTSFPRTTATTAAAIAVAAAVAATSPGGVVGGDGDSPTCPRRALPSEHRLADSAASPRDGRGPLSQAPAHSSAGWTAASAGHGPRLAPPLQSSANTSNVSAKASRVTALGPSSALLGGAKSSLASRGQKNRDELETQLVRVMAERDAARREVAALRKEVAALQLALAARDAADTESDAVPHRFMAETEVREAEEEDNEEEEEDALLPSALTDRPASALQSVSSPTPSRTVLSGDAGLLDDEDAVPPSRPPRVLAVEMSGHSSSATSEYGVAGGEARETVGGAQAAQARGQRTASSAGAAPTDRRALAALFMAKLNISSSSSGAERMPCGD